MRSYTYDEARAASLKYFDGEELAANVVTSKYLLKDLNGTFHELNPDDMHRRQAREIARIEKKYPNAMSEDEIFELLRGFKRVVLQGSPMSAIGNPFQVQSLSNCFVIAPPHDSYGSIARADEEILQIQKRRGGVGVDLSNIRPKHLAVHNAARSSDGVLIFMNRYSNTTLEVAQGGRRGALMETLDVRHPDVEIFIDAKKDLTKVTGANVSVRVNDELMRAVVDDLDFDLRWPVNASVADAKVSRRIRARDLWKKMMHAAWSSAEPGVLFWDTVLRWSMADAFADKGFKTICTNPCSELPLSAYCSCRLVLINALSYVKNAYLATASFDFVAFHSDVVKAQRVMDNIVDLELEAIDRIIEKVTDDPEPDSEKSRELSLWCKVRAMCADGRRTGTGLTAVGDVVAAMGQRYGSPASVDLVEQIYKTMAVAAHTSSVIMARERGAFPAWEPDRYVGHPFAQRLASACSDDVNSSFEMYGRRNIALTTTAPAGSVSVLTQTTSGIEPVYLPRYKRRKKLADDDIRNGARVDFVDALGDRWQEHTVYHRGVKTWMEATGQTDVEKSPYWGSSSNDIDWSASVDVLAAAQRWTEHAISKTVNLPNSATEELVSEVYLKAWRLGIKGITVYRDGCRSGVLLPDVVEEKTGDDDIVDHHAPKRPKELPCDVHRVSVKGEQYLVLVGLLNGRPYEVFAGLSEHVDVPRKARVGVLMKNGKKDGVATYNLTIPVGDDDHIVVKDVVAMFDNPEHGALTRVISMSLRHGVPTNFIAEQLRKDKHSDLQSFSTIIARVLKGYIKDGTAVTTEKKCDACGGTNLHYLQGCATCADCANSKCG